jgi:RNA polymerase sigma-54 factor
MALKPSLQLRVSQHLALTPQLQQSIRLLQISTLELSQEVEQMLDDNPFLERAQDEAMREEFGLQKADAKVADDDRDAEFSAGASAEPFETLSATTSTNDETTPLSADDSFDWDGDGSLDMSADDKEWGGDAGLEGAAAARSAEGDADATELARSQESLQDHLHRQTLGLRLSAGDSAALRFLIESLNEDGYLEDSLEDLAQSLAPDTGDPLADAEELDELLHHFTVALGLLHSLEPAGVGARNLGECLGLQLQGMALLLDDQPLTASARAKQMANIQTAQLVCAQPTDLMARRDYKRLAAVCGCTEAAVRDALSLITHLEPKPGRKFINLERNVVVPDVLVVMQGSGAATRFRVQLNPEVMPRLRVHDIYASALKGGRGARDGKDSAGHAAMQQRLQEARWFIKNIQQRFDTILRVSTAIVERQRNFFLHGALAMRPLVLREIADELGLHESTISRVTTAKFMATPYGTFELKYFFGSSLGTETGGNASSTAVRALIQQFIEAEPIKKPLSDSQISAMLKEQGIECARRTVAKYREGLRIAPANLRKAIGGSASS